MKEYFSPQDNAPKIGFEVLILIRSIVKKKNSELAYISGNPAASY